MYGNWRENVKDMARTSRADLRPGDLKQCRPQQHMASQATGHFQPNKGAQPRTQQHNESGVPFNVQSSNERHPMGKINVDTVALMNGAQRGPPPDSRDRHSQSRGADRTNIYAPARGNSVCPNLGGQLGRQTNTFIPKGKPQRQTMQKSMYKLGVVIRAPHHEEDRDGGNGGSFRGPDVAAQMARTLTKTVTGEWLFTKHRKFIVVALHKNNYHALPLYTHNGNGLTGNNLDPDEWVSVQDHRAAPVEAQSRHRAVRTETLEDHVWLFHPKSAANLAYGVPRPYNLPVVYEGKLSDDSRDYLLRLYQDRTNRGSSL